MDILDRIINICLEYTNDVYIGPDLVNADQTLEEDDGMVFTPSWILKRSLHELSSVYVYQSIVAVRMKSEYIEDLAKKLANYRLAVTQCVANREGDCVLKFVFLNDD